MKSNDITNCGSVLWRVTDQGNATSRTRRPGACPGDVTLYTHELQQTETEGNAAA